MGSAPAGADADLVCLFATLRGSPFADVPYNINVKVLPADQIAAVETKPFNSASHSIFFTENDHVPVIASLPAATSSVSARARHQPQLGGAHDASRCERHPALHAAGDDEGGERFAGLPRHHGAQHEPLRRCGVQPNGVAGPGGKRHEP